MSLLTALRINDHNSHPLFLVFHRTWESSVLSIAPVVVHPLLNFLHFSLYLSNFAQQILRYYTFKAVLRIISPAFRTLSSSWDNLSRTVFRFSSSSFAFMRYKRLRLGHRGARIYSLSFFPLLCWIISLFIVKLLSFLCPPILTVFNRYGSGERNSSKRTVIHITQNIHKLCTIWANFSYIHIEQCQQGFLIELRDMKFLHISYLSYFFYGATDTGCLHELTLTRTGERYSLRTFLLYGRNCSPTVR